MSEPNGIDARSLCVVIPTRGRAATLALTLSALEAQTVTGFETVVVVDGADQDLPEAGRATVLTQDHRGPGAARNRGVANTEAEIVLFLGDDIVPRPGLVAAHLEVHRRHRQPEVGALGLTSWHPAVAGGVHNRWLAWSGSQFDYEGISGEDAGWARLYSSNVSLKRRFFLAGGGFDEDFRFDYEDLDLAWRLHLGGLRLLFAPDARAEHLHGYSWTDLVRRYHSRGTGERLMAQKHPWFEPWFARRLRAAGGEKPRSALWVAAARWADPAPPRLRAALRSGADSWYHQHLLAPFFGGWHGTDDVEELQAYLGDRFDPQALADHRALVEADERAAPDHATLYRTSEAYLYDLTMFSVWGTKEPYLAALRRLVPAPARLLDYGCGIGSDGLRLIGDGYEVAFADFDNPSTRYLRWRLARRGLDVPVHDVERGVGGNYDLVYAFDVIEHVDDPRAFLALIEAKAALVMVNLLEADPAEAHVHHRLPIARLMAHATRCGLLHYHRYERRSHLLVYRSPLAASAGGQGSGRSVRVLTAGLLERVAERLVPMT